MVEIVDGSYRINPVKPITLNEEASVFLSILRLPVLFDVCWASVGERDFKTIVEIPNSLVVDVLCFD
jgi:hypothetical protein